MRPAFSAIVLRYPLVSIHALLAECDPRPDPHDGRKQSFNPRTPCGVRPKGGCGWPGRRRFNPRTPCGVRLFRKVKFKTPEVFQSTHSLRSATLLTGRVLVLHQVSIHALLAECDARMIPSSISGICFNPRTPCGVRLVKPGANVWMLLFQSTHSLRSATGNGQVFLDSCRVSIHALLAECDSFKEGVRGFVLCFNPRTPCGVRLRRIKRQNQLPRFQSTHSLRSATSPRRDNVAGVPVSIHALLAECDTRIL